MSLRACSMIVGPCLEGSPEVVCGNPARRGILDMPNDACCDSCFDRMLAGGDFTFQELDSIYPVRPTLSVEESTA